MFSFQFQVNSKLLLTFPLKVEAPSLQCHPDSTPNNIGEEESFTDGVSRIGQEHQDPVVGPVKPTSQAEADYVTEIGALTPGWTVHSDQDSRLYYCK